MEFNIKTLSTRLRLRYDTLENWEFENPVLLVGEAAVVTLNNNVYLKIGDGASPFHDLPYVFAQAQDIYDWAKAAHPGDSILIESQTDLPLDFGGDVLTGIEWNQDHTKLVVHKAKLPTVSHKADKVAAAHSGNLAGLDANGNLTDSGESPDTLKQDATVKANAAREAAISALNAAIASLDALDPAEPAAATTTFVVGVTEVDGRIQVTMAPVKFPVTSVANKTGDVTLNKLIIGSKSYDGSDDVEITVADLGLDKAISFIGDSTTEPTIDGATVAGHDTWARGEVVLYGVKEYILIGDENVAANWRVFGDEGSYALKTIQMIAGEGLAGGGSLEADRTITHYTPAAGSGSAVAAGAGSGKRYVTSIKVDKFGHITAVESTDWGFTDLDYDDTAVDKQVVTRVTETDGKIAVERKEIMAATGLEVGVDANKNIIIDIDDDVTFVLLGGDAEVNS